MAHKKILLIGNGLNRISDGGASWNALLNSLAGTPRTHHENEVRKAKPFTLLFEEVASGGYHQKLKLKIAANLKKRVAPNKHHKDIMALNFEHILTTNYDYNLESADAASWFSNLPARENFYSLFRRRSSDNRNVWHIHGELDVVNTIMLGHEQYSGYHHKIRSYLNSGVETDVKDRNGRPYLSKFSRKNSGSLLDIESWVDLFLEHEVHIIGFGLDYTENHLWNLITEKQRLSRKGHLIGKTVFHRCADGPMRTEDEAKMSILAALGSHVIDHVGSSYAEAYDECILSLR